MNDEEMNEGPLSLGLDEVEAPSLEEEGEEEVVSPLAAVGAASAVTPQDFLSRLLAREEEAAKRERELFQADIKRIQAAKDRLLGKPKELTGRERLDIILKTLSSRPTDLRDPRFFERKNIGTFLRDIGEAGGAMRETEKTRAEEMQKQLDELEAKEAAILLPRAQAELKDIRGRIPAAMRAVSEANKPQRLQGIAQQIVDLRQIIDNPDSYNQEQRDAASRQLKSIGEKTSPEDRSTLGQIIRATEMVKSQDPKQREIGQRYLNNLGVKPIALTVSQMREDAQIEAAKKFLEEVPQEERDRALRKPSSIRTPRDDMIVKAIELSQMPTFQSVLPSGTTTAAPVSDGGFSATPIEE